MASTHEETPNNKVKLKGIAELRDVVRQFIDGSDTANVAKCLDLALGCFENVSIFQPALAITSNTNMR